MSFANEGLMRTMTRDDLKSVLAWRNHPDVRRYMYTQHEISRAEHTDWFARAAEDPQRHLLIFELNDAPMGFVNLHQIAPGAIADWGFYLTPDAPKGTGQKLGNCALNHAFQVLNLHKVCGQAIEYNDRSVRFHLRMGFQQEGLLQDHHFDGEKYHNVVCFGLLAAQWQATNER